MDGFEPRPGVSTGGAAGLTADEHMSDPPTPIPADGEGAHLVVASCMRSSSAAAWVPVQLGLARLRSATALYLLYDGALADLERIYGHHGDPPLAQVMRPNWGLNPRPRSSHPTLVRRSLM